MCIVYRYEDESKKEVENKTNHFSELLKRIEERKRQRAAVNNKSTLNKDENNLEEPKKKKKKKLLEAEKSNDLHTEDKIVSSEKIDEHTIETAKVSTKKKKKKKDIEDIDKLDSIATDNNIDLEEKDKNLAEENNDDKDTANKETSLQSNFIILGAKSRKKQREVKRVLPDWLAHPEIISADLNSGPPLEELESVLEAKLIEILRANGIIKLFPVQSNIIKWLHQCNIDRKMGWWPRDTCVSAPTGSGKYLQQL